MSNPLDRAIDDWMQSHQHPALDRLFNALMWLGTSLPGMGLVALVIVVVCVRRRRPFVALATIVGVVVTQLVGVGIKALVRRHRPPAALPRLGLTDWSFPSTAVAVCTAGLVVLFALAGARGRRPLTAAFVLLDALVAFGVMYLGAHWFTDTLGGATVGCFCGWLARRAALALELRRSGHGANPTDPTTPRGVSAST